MTLYRHYKDKPYRYRGLVKHSESLEDLVLYECLYDNSLGNLWVRPKDMFFEEIEHQGTIKPRFEKVPVKIDSLSSLDAKAKSTVNAIGRKCFEIWSEGEFDRRLASQNTVLLNIASIDGKPVGFKLGYTQADDVFYSWLGAVLPEHQGAGISKILMNAQHEWVIAEGFRLIRTKCLNFNLSMLTLNLKHGFLVIDTEITEQGLKLILEKRLVEGEYS